MYALISKYINFDLFLLISNEFLLNAGIRWNAVPIEALFASYKPNNGCIKFMRT